MTLYQTITNITKVTLNPIDGGRGLDLQEGALRVEGNIVYDYGFGIEIGTEKSGEKVDNVVQSNLILSLTFARTASSIPLGPF